MVTTTTTLPTTEYVFLTALDLIMIIEQHNTMMSNYDKHHICQPYRMNETTHFTHIENVWHPVVLLHNHCFFFLFVFGTFFVFSTINWVFFGTSFSSVKLTNFSFHL
jgi:hypothetical protein